MNVFVLCTGRCGSVTFIESAKHITNYTAGHETRCHWTGDKRFAYPRHHIEADNRLSWILGRLNSAYGDNAVYVHLTRDREATAKSYAKRGDRGILAAYRTEILMRAPIRNVEDDMFSFALDYCDTVNENIRMFLQDKSLKMEIGMEHAREQLPDFWQMIGADGDMEKALLEWDVKHNASDGLIAEKLEIQ